MKFYSEETKKFYDSEKECAEAENKFVTERNNKAAARKADAEKVEKSFEAFKAAREEYYKNLNEFCDKYGTFHKTISGKDILKPIDLFDLFF